jgi:hypothetical protein
MTVQALRSRRGLPYVLVLGHWGSRWGSNQPGDGPGASLG